MRRRAGIARELASRADQRVLRWFGHMERMGIQQPSLYTLRMARIKGVDAYVSEGRVRVRPRLGCMDDVKVALGGIGMTMEAARKI